MKRLLTTTVLVSALSVSTAFAQTAAPANPDATTGATTSGSAASTLPAITVPEGFARQEARITADDLLGATIYDAAGKSIGEVRDLVFAIDDTSMNNGAMSSGTTGGKTSMDGTANPPSAMDSTAPAAGATGSASSTTGTTGTGTTGTDAAAISGTDTGTSGSATGTTGTTDMGSTGSTTGAAGGTDMSATGSVSVPAAGQKGEVTHAILDIGGFLGLGQHTVAVPVTDLAVYSSSSQTRVYLPWTQAQLEALPTYDENDPSTLGRSLGAMSN